MVRENLVRPDGHRRRGHRPRPGRHQQPSVRKDYLQPVQDVLSDVPPWVWAAGAAVIAAYIWHASRRAEAEIKQAVYTGAGGDLAPRPGNTHLGRVAPYLTAAGLGIVLIAGITRRACAPSANRVKPPRSGPRSRRSKPTSAKPALQPRTAPPAPRPSKPHPHPTIAS